MIYDSKVSDEIHFISWTRFKPNYRNLYRMFLFGSETKMPYLGLKKGNEI